MSARFVRLHMKDGRPTLIRAERIEQVFVSKDGDAHIWLEG